jgi:amidase
VDTRSPRPSHPSTDMHQATTTGEGRSSDFEEPFDPFDCMISRTDIVANPDGPLRGFDLVVKDLFDVKGEPTGAGNPTWRAESPPADRTARVVEQIMEAGARYIGKSKLDEFAYSLSGFNPHYSTPRNPKAPDRLPGGSSSGSAVAVAAGLASIGLATDTGGSIRVPASYCGIVGVRPTHGRLSVQGLQPLAPTFDTVGWMTTTAWAARLVGEVLLDEDEPRPRRRPTRLLVVEDAFDELEPEALQSVDAAIHEIEDRLGLRCEQATLAAGDLKAWFEVFRPIQGAEAYHTFHQWWRAHPDAVGPNVTDRLLAGSQVDAAAVDEARRRRADLIRLTATQLTDADAILALPSAPGPAPILEDGVAPPGEAVRMRTLRLTCVASLLGAPAVSLPLAECANAPIGVCLVALPGEDRLLLEVAEAAMKGREDGQPTQRS